MADTKIQVLDDGPLVVNGQAEVLDASGNSFGQTEPIALCRCGLANNKPFCDGTHQGKFKDSVRAK